MTELEKERLRDFFRLTFNQDWDLDSPTAEGVRQEYVLNGYSRAELDSVASLIRRYSASFKNDSDLEENLVTDCQCCFIPSVAGLSASGWLEWIASYLSSAKHGGAWT